MGLARARRRASGGEGGREVGREGGSEGGREGVREGLREEVRKHCCQRGVVEQVTHPAPDKEEWLRRAKQNTIEAG